MGKSTVLMDVLQWHHFAKYFVSNGYYLPCWRTTSCARDCREMYYLCCYIVDCANWGDKDKEQVILRLPSIILYQGDQTHELNKKRQDVCLSRMKCEVNEAW